MCIGLRLGTLAWEGAVCKQSDPGQAAAFQKPLQPRGRATRGRKLAGTREPAALCFVKFIWDLKPVSTASGCSLIYLGQFYILATFQNKAALKKKERKKKAIKLEVLLVNGGQVIIRFYGPHKIKLSFLKMSVCSLGKGEMSKDC